MAGTVLTDLNAITLTTTAKAAAQAKGANLPDLMNLCKEAAIELSRLITETQKYHPSGGGDATNYAALTTIIGELA